MLARRLTTILPAMTLAEALETTPIQYDGGVTGDRAGLVMTHPCRALHHTISDVGLIGGGHVPMPGSQLWILPLTYHHRLGSGRCGHRRRGGPHWQRRGTRLPLHRQVCTQVSRRWIPCASRSRS
jgi:Magnesium chelatase, subunit ChlI